MKQPRSFLAAGVVCAVALTLSPGKAEAYGTAAAYAAGYTTGYYTACVICDAAIVSAFSTVEVALAASEQTIIEAMGMGASGTTGMVGFPALANTIEASEGKTSQNLVQALELATKTLAAELRRIPVDNQKYQLEKEIGEATVSYEKETCKGLDMGRTFDLGGESSLGLGWSWLTGKVALTDQATSDSERPESMGELSLDEARAEIASSNTNSSRIAQHQALRSARARAENDGVSLSGALGGALLVSDTHRTIEPDSDEDRNLDILAQFWVMDTPSEADALEKLATSSASIARVTDSKITRMEASIAMAIQDRFTKLRRAHAGSLGVESYMLSALGQNVDESDAGALSDEGFMHLMATQRARNPRWIANVSVDERYAAQQLARMEAEHLYLKYQRYLAKRDINLALAQVLSNELEKERP